MSIFYEFLKKKYDKFFHYFSKIFQNFFFMIYSLKCLAKTTKYLENIERPYLDHSLAARRQFLRWGVFRPTLWVTQVKNHLTIPGLILFTSLKPTESPTQHISTFRTHWGATKIQACSPHQRLFSQSRPLPHLGH